MAPWQENKVKFRRRKSKTEKYFSSKGCEKFDNLYKVCIVAVHLNVNYKKHSYVKL